MFLRTVNGKRAAKMRNVKRSKNKNKNINLDGLTLVVVVDDVMQVCKLVT